jgi:hypothetical protein
MKLVKIPIKRFLPETPLARDTFLFLPLNNKSIRIGLAGEGLSDSLLEKLSAKGHTHLHIDEPQEIDPENFPVHLGPARAQEAEPAITAPPAQPAEVSETSLKGKSSPLPETEHSFSASPASAIEENTFSPDRASPPTSTLVKGHPEAPDQTETRLKSSPIEKESAQRVSGASEEEDKTINRFSAEKEVDPTVFRLSQALDTAESSLRSGNRAALEGQRDQILRDAKSVILSSKVADKILTISQEADKTEQADQKATLRGQIRELRGVLETIELEGDTAAVSAEKELSSLEKSLFSSESNEVAKASAEISGYVKTKEKAQIAIEKHEEEETELMRSSSSRDLPATVARLAAYLGHSLGYTNVDFLADLACNAVLHFNQKEGASLDTSQLPALSKLLLSNEEVKPSILTEDTKAVVLFLDAYIEDEECDRSQKDFVKKVFDRAVAELSKSESGPSIWNVKKWESFVRRGPTVDSHSICMRAAAKAQKIARAAII